LQLANTEEEDGTCCRKLEEWKKSIVHRATSGWRWMHVPMTKDGPGNFILIQPKWKKALTTGPLLAGVGCSNDKGWSRALHPDSTKMEKNIICRASTGIGCSNDKGRSRVLHPDLTKTEKSIVHSAYSGIECSNDKGRSQVLHPDLSNAACLPAKRGYSHEFTLQWGSTLICTILCNTGIYIQSTSNLS
jgi:hypothetical protein